MTAKTMTLRPRLSEKTYSLSQAANEYVFIVPDKANKHTVAEAVSVQYKVTVERVRIANIKGKAKRTIMKRGRPIAGSQADKKKAYVRLKEGDNLPVFAAVEEAEKKAEKTGKAVEKAAEKAEKKTAKKEKK